MKDNKATLEIPLLSLGKHVIIEQTQISPQQELSVCSDGGVEEDEWVTGSLGAVDNRNADATSALLSTQQLCSWLHWCCCVPCTKSVRGHCHDLPENKADQEFFVCAYVHYIHAEMQWQTVVFPTLFEVIMKWNRCVEVIALTHVSCLW